MVPKVPVGSSLNNTPNTIPYVDVNYTFLPYQLTSNRYLPTIGAEHQANNSSIIGDQANGKEEIETNSDEASFEGVNEKG